MTRRAGTLVLLILALFPPATRAADGARWTRAVHGFAFLTANRQGGDSGDQDFESQNHLMVMAMRPAGRWSLALLGTFSLEPLTIPRQGSPLLFQRGETYNDVLLVDRQHPHDLFLQLAAEGSRDLGRRTRLRLYVAPLGEATVGPTAYVHRPSSSANPLTPLAHHNQDSTHLTADVLAAGVDAGPVTLEGSVFHGQEPDENRYDIDQGALDSYAGRLWIRTAPWMRLQISAARREHPEAVEEGNQTRQTASIEIERTTGSGFVAAALIAGRNLLEDGQVEWGSTLEATWKFAQRHTIYGRAERVDRDRFELQNKTQRPETVSPARTTVDALTIGYLRDLPLLSEAQTALGAAATVYRYDDALDPVYGERPMSAQIFLRLLPRAGGAAHHHH